MAKYCTLLHYYSKNVGQEDKKGECFEALESPGDPGTPRSSLMVVNMCCFFLGMLSMAQGTETC